MDLDLVTKRYDRYKDIAKRMSKEEELQKSRVNIVTRKLRNAGYNVTIKDSEDVMVFIFSKNKITKALGYQKEGFTSYQAFINVLNGYL